MFVKLWPNGRGCDVTAGRALFEVWADGRARHLVRDETLTGSSGTHWIEFDHTGLSLEGMAYKAVRLWRDARHEWTPCEN
jgi:hypothetical protein